MSSLTTVARFSTGRQYSFKSNKNSVVSTSIIDELFELVELLAI